MSRRGKPTSGKEVPFVQRHVHYHDDEDYDVAMATSLTPKATLTTAEAIEGFYAVSGGNVGVGCGGGGGGGRANGVGEPASDGGARSGGDGGGGVAGVDHITVERHFSRKTIDTRSHNIDIDNPIDIGHSHDIPPIKPATRELATTWSGGTKCRVTESQEEKELGFASTWTGITDGGVREFGRGGISGRIADDGRRDLDRLERLQRGVSNGITATVQRNPSHPRNRREGLMAGVEGKCKVGDGGEVSSKTRSGGHANKVSFEAGREYTPRTDHHSNHDNNYDDYGDNVNQAVEKRGNLRPREIDVNLSPGRYTIKRNNKGHQSRDAKVVNKRLQIGQRVHFNIP